MPMQKGTRLRILGSLAVAAAIALPTGSAMAAAPGSMPYTCAGGDFASGNFTTIPSGNYASITVTGVCNIQPDAVINVVGNINVAAGAVLDAQSAPSTITVGHNVTAGCRLAPRHGLPADKLHRQVRGSAVRRRSDRAHHHHRPRERHGHRREHRPAARQLTVGGNVTLTGGGGEIPWSIKGNTIGGNLTISGVTADWLGVQFNRIGGNATLTDITVPDPERPGPDRRRRGKHGWAQPHLHGTGPRRVRRFHPRRGQPRRSQGDRSVRIPGLT